jgi:uncharacterized protein YhaN
MLYNLVMRGEKKNGISGLRLEENGCPELVSLQALLKEEEARAEAERLAAEVSRLQRTKVEVEERLAQEAWEKYRKEQEQEWNRLKGPATPSPCEERQQRERSLPRAAAAQAVERQKQLEVSAAAAARARAVASQRACLNNPWRPGGPMHQLASYYRMGWQASRLAGMGIKPDPVQQQAMRAFRFR